MFISHIGSAFPSLSQAPPIKLVELGRIALPTTACKAVVILLHHNPFSSSSAEMLSRAYIVTVKIFLTLLEFRSYLPVRLLAFLPTVSTGHHIHSGPTLFTVHAGMLRVGQQFQVGDVIILLVMVFMVHKFPAR